MSIRARELSKSFGSLQVVKAVSLECRRGEVCAVVGPNGAGKTTLFKMLLGLLTPDTGLVVLPAEENVRIGGFVEKPSSYPYLSGSENLKVFSAYHKKKLDRGEARTRLKAVGLDPDRTDPVRNYSMGMKQRLGIAIALLSEPTAMVLDEPFSGLDPTGIRDLSVLLRRLARERNMAILVSSHFVDQLIRFCDRIYVIGNGQVLASGGARELLRQHTSGFTIEGPALADSAILREMGVKVVGQSAFVDAELFNEGRLIEQLSQEGTRLYSCVPQLDLDHLFEPTG